MKIRRVEDRAALENRDDMINLSPPQQLFAHPALPFITVQDAPPQPAPSRGR